MNKKEKIKQLKNKNGITLIALVVTIIVLIILAAVSISLVLGENGIITKSRDAARRTEEAKLNEEVATNELMEQWEGLVGGGSASTNPETPENPEKPTETKTVEEMKAIKDNYMTAKTTLKDSNGNLIVVPEGFKIAEDSGKNVTEGIVIEDNDIIEGVGNGRGNQYVWIPVGENIKKQDEHGTITEVDITLGRYVFADGTNHKAEDGITVLPKGTPILKQSGENYEDETPIHITEVIPTSNEDYVFKELKIYREGIMDYNNGTNTTALDLKGFIDSIKANGGYYIARYEASYGVDGKVNSKISDSAGAWVPTSTGESDGYLWSVVPQRNASRMSKGLYEKATTDLINSYAWDTALVYIQSFSKYTDYSCKTLQSYATSKPSNTGVNGDEACKINDMAANLWEWTTEYSTKIDWSLEPCTIRSGGITSMRDGIDSYYAEYSTFRVILYI